MERLHLQDIIQDMEDNFDYKKYLAEGKLLKEEVDVLGNEFLQEIQDDMKMYYKMDVDMDDIKDWVNMYYIGYNSEYDEGPGDVDYEGNEFGSEDYESEKKELVFDTAEREDFYMHLNPEADSTFPNLAEGRLLKEAYNLPDSDSTTDKYVNNHWDGILKDILRAHTDLRNSKGGESIPERPSQLDIDIVLGRFDGANEFMDVDPNEYNEYFDFYDMYLVTQRDEENTKDISVEDYPEGDYSGYTKRDDLPKLDEGKLYEEEKMYTLYTTNVEYDNGKTGYMYQLVNSEDGEENEIGFDQLHFVGKGDASDPLLVPGKDFKDYDQYSYQEEEVSAEEAMKIYNELN